MLELDKVDHATFTPFIGQTFDVVFSDGRLPLTLAAIRTLGSARLGASREPFALTFHGKPSLRLPQHIYRLEHGTLGAMEVFLVQTGADASASQFEAIFN